MSYSQHDVYSDDPLEQIANPVKRKLSSILALLLLLVGGTYLVQTTLAANISINSGPVEFGQGVTQTAACSGATNLTITPNSSFVNASGGGAHYFSSVTVTNVPTSCYGKDFTIKAFNNTSSSPLAIFNTSSTSAVVWNDGGTFKLGTGSSGMTIAQSAGTFTVTFTSPVALSSTVFKLTVESGAHTDAYGVGLPGPGGGTIFYYSEAGFNCGPTHSATGSPTGGLCNYLEVAPNLWSGGSDPTKYWEPNQTSFRTSTVASIPTETSVNNSSGAVGLGYKYTLAIYGQSSDTSTAAAAARAYSPIVSGTTVTDWYLPTSTELNLMCQWQRGVTQSVTTVCSGGTLNSGSGASGFSTSSYWASSQYNVDCAWSQNFGTGVQSILNTWKNNEGSLRPIRAF